MTEQKLELWQISMGAKELHDATLRKTVKAIYKILDESLACSDITEEWLAHIAGTDGKCDCDIEINYDRYIEVTYCDTYSKNMHQQYLEWHGITEEEHQARLAAEHERKAREQAEQAERDKAYRLKQLWVLAEEFGIDPRLLP